MTAGGPANKGAGSPAVVMKAAGPIQRLVDVKSYAMVARAAAAAKPAPKPTQPARPAPKKAAVPVPARGIQLTGIHQARWLTPTLATRLYTIPTLHAGEPRSQVDVPIAPSATVTDTMLFEDPKDSGTTYYLPRYRVTETTAVGGAPHFSVALAATENGGTLTVGLTKFPPPELEKKLGDARELPHRAAVVLRFRFGPGGGATKELVFDSVEPTDDGLDATLEMTGAELNQVYGVLKDRESGAELLVRRAIDVALPVDGPSPTPASGHPGPQLHLQMLRLEGPSGGGKPRMIRMDPARLGALRMKPGVQGHPAKPAPPSGAGEPAQPSGPLFRRTTRNLECSADPDPFSFDPDLNPYVYSGASGVSGSSAGLERRQKKHGGAWFSYYQDEAEPGVFYYLPDSFKIARRPESPHSPFMSVSFQGGSDGSDGTMIVHFTCVGAPWVDLARLEAAKDALAEYVPRGGEARLEPLAVGSATLDLQHLPTAVRKQLADGVPVDLRTGFRFDLQVDLSQFQEIFNALFGASLSLLDGSVTIPLGGTDEAADQVPFEASMADLVGPLFDVDTGPDGPGNDLNVRVTEAIESPLTLDGLAVRLFRGDASVDSKITKISSADGGDANELPKSLDPGDELRLAVEPSSPLPGQGPVAIGLRPSGLAVQPDQDAVWQSILDPSVLPEYAQEIHVFALPEWFQDKDDPKKSVRAIVVEFEGGDSARLTPDQLDATAEVDRPISDLIRRKKDDPEPSYRYRVTLVRSGGSSDALDWQEATSDTLYPNIA